jgi:dipeptidyl aminopeptidase/acylaminoacyl peptidase
LVLQSLAVETRFCAVAVESPFSTAQKMSYERVSGPLHLKPWFGRTLARPVIWSAVLYARLRYGIDLLQPSPLEAVKHSATPVFLIHGVNDASIAPYHSQLIAKAAPDHVQLWIVPNAGHTMAWRAEHQEFERRLLAWFALHRKPAKQVADSVIPSSSGNENASEFPVVERASCVGPSPSINYRASSPREFPNSEQSEFSKNQYC